MSERALIVIAVGFALSSLAGSSAIAQTHVDPPPSQQTPATSAKADSAKSLQENVKTAVVDSEPRLGKLEPWQKKLFDEEVVPESQKFVRDFSGTSAIVDVDSIRNYLRFYGPSAFHGHEPGAPIKILAYIRTAPGCDACAQGRDRIQALIKGRLERRGLAPVWLTSEEAEGQGITGSPKQVADRLEAAVQAQGGSADLVVLIDPVPVDDLDSAHADEKRYMVRTTIDLRDLAREEGHMEVMDPEPFDGPVTRLMSDAFTDVGAKLAKMPSDESAPGSSEVRIEVRGTGDFSTYAHARDALADKLKGDGSLEEREIARGHAVFALITNRSPASVRKDLGDVMLENGAIGLVPGAQDGIVMEVHQ